MPDLIYDIGTVSIGLAATTVVGAGGPLWLSNVMKFDVLVVDGFGPVDILDVTANAAIIIAKWPYAAVPAGTHYQILQKSPLRFSGAQTSASVIELISDLETDGFYIFVRSDLTEPDARKGDEGQYARQPSTGKEWIKQGGDWTFLGVSKPLGTPAAYDNAHTYNLMDVVSSGGSSYVWINPTPGSGHAPPDSTYWVVLADRGAQGPQGIQGKGYGGTTTTSLTVGTGNKTFTTQAGLAYQPGGRGRLWASGGQLMEGLITAYDITTGAMTIAVDNTLGSGTIASWNLNLAGEKGTGDVSSVNYGSEYAANKPLFRTNIGINQAVALAASQDFNAVGAEGTYYTIDNASTNAPVASQFWYLEVRNYNVDITNYIKQTATLLSGTTSVVYQRVKVAGAWKAWRVVLFGDDNLASLTDAAAAFRNLGGLDLSSVVNLTAASTLTATAFGRLHFITATSSGFTTTLPTPVGNAGKMISFLVGDTTVATKLFTITTPAGVIGRSGASMVMWANESVTLRSNGTNWEVIAAKQIPFVGRMFRTTDQGSNSTGVVVAFTSHTSPSGLALPFATDKFQAPRASTFFFTLYAFQTATAGATSNAAYLSDTAASPLGPVYQAVGASPNSAFVQVATKLDCTAGQFVCFGSRINGSSGNNIAGATTPTTMEYVEVCPSW